MMLKAIRNYLFPYSSESLSHYYQNRLKNADGLIEREAILYTQSLISLYDWYQTQDEEKK